jgi:hypothetical protein
MNWKSALKADPVPWLLEEENPSVRYFTLVDIEGLNPLDKQALSCKKEIMARGVVPRILSRQREGGYWEKREDFYERTKYRGTVWQLIILAELGAAGDDERIKKACEFVLRISQDRQSGGFSYRGNEASGGYHSCVLPCLTGNMVWSLIRMGYIDDRRTQQGINWITTYQRFDDGVVRPPRAWPYEKREACWGRHSCHMGVVKALKALAEIPEETRSQEVNATIEHAAEYFLRHHVFKRSHDLTRVAKPKWVRFGFPTIWDSDALEVLGLLVRLGYKDPRLQEAVNLVLAKQDEQGRWYLENTYNGRVQVNIEQKGRPSKWVTLHALKALRGFFSI